MSTRDLWCQWCGRYLSRLTVTLYARRGWIRCGSCKGDTPVGDADGHPEPDEDITW